MMRRTHQLILALLIIGLIAKVLSLTAMYLSIRERRKDKDELTQ